MSGFSSLDSNYVITRAKRYCLKSQVVNKGTIYKTVSTKFEQVTWFEEVCNAFLNFVFHPNILLLIFIVSLELGKFENSKNRGSTLTEFAPSLVEATGSVSLAYSSYSSS